MRRVWENARSPKGGPCKHRKGVPSKGSDSEDSRGHRHHLTPKPGSATSNTAVGPIFVVPSSGWPIRATQNLGDSRLGGHSCGPVLRVVCIVGPADCLGNTIMAFGGKARRNVCLQQARRSGCKTHSQESERFRHAPNPPTISSGCSRLAEIGEIPIFGEGYLRECNCEIPLGAPCQQDRRSSKSAQGEHFAMI